MNDRSIIQTPDPSGRDLWVDRYLPSDMVEGPQPAGFQIDTAWLRGALFRQRWLVGATILAGLLFGLIITLLTTPIYQANATVRIQPWGNFIVEGQDVATAIGSSNEIDLFMETQGTVIESRNLAEVVANDLNLGSRNALLGAAIDEGRPPQRSDEQWAEDKRLMAISSLQAGVSADVPVNSQIITINFQSEDPALAAEIVNAYAEAFQQSDTRRNVESNAYAREYLTQQIVQVRERLDEAERAANDYARSSGIVTARTTGSDGDSGQTITGANLTNINVTVAQARAARIAAEQKWRSVSAIPASQLPEVQANPVIQDLTTQRAELQGQLTNLRQRYNDQFPEIRDILARIALIDNQIAQTGENIKATIRSEFVIARNQEAALAGELNSATDDALVEQDQNVEYSGLEREADALRGQLESLLTRFNSISTAANVQSGAITILDSAVVPRSPVSPNIARNMIIALVLAVAAAGGLALIREIFVDQFRRTEDIDERLGLPVLGLTPHVKAEDIDRQEANQFSSLMEAYASIRSTIDFAVPRDGAVVQLTSSQASEGKSTTALILAELFARLGRRTLLIDADLRKPSIVKLLDVESKDQGITEVLLGHAKLEDAIIEGVHENLQILSVAGIPPNPVELLSSRRFKEFIDDQRENYSIILIDSPPVLGLADAPEIAQCVDASIFVIEANRTSFAQARSAVKRLTHVGANLIGAVLTKYRALEAGSDYAYQYQYYQYGDNK
ncbi:polysaccharide biosynthesis tyrosine autokinase [uncultured Erythrobacter sp.]|uniref:GumC family protein n=1 Tax=uncultured Erythrobacter sp. TaxID=263913 RepID=UPI002632DA2B|nr:polysaccharide biosynthesis tyrosine autokinase [uncultured Erythrobacter sp.]